MSEDLGVKIGTKEEVFWTGVKKKCEELIKQCEHEILIQGNILKFAEEKIAEEKQKLKQLSY